MNKIAAIQEELASVISGEICSDGVIQTAIPSLVFARQSHISIKPSYGVFNPSICIIAQGEKEIFLEKERFHYSPSDYLVTSSNLPITAQVVAASVDAPYLAMILNFSDVEIIDAIQEIKPLLNPKKQTERAMYVEPTSEPLLDAALRLVHLLKSPDEIDIYAPLYKKEILYRILRGSCGSLLAQTMVEGSSTWHVLSVIKHIRDHFNSPFHIEELADMANMSIPSLHRHFKAVTAMSTIQFQKKLRLQEARRLLLTKSFDAAEAAWKVGYESPSQFSREYARMFGTSPIHDVKGIRNMTQETSPF